MNDIMRLHHRKVGVGVVLAGLFLEIGVVRPAPKATARRARMVAVHPDGVCRIGWSGDSGVVRLDPDDSNQTMELGHVWFDALTRRRLTAAEAGEKFSADPKKLFLSPRYEVGTYVDVAPKGASLWVHLRSGGPRLPLIGTDWKHFGTENSDASTKVRHYQDLQFSVNEREISILSGREVRVWSTRTGQLVRRVVLATPQKSVQSAAFSPDRKWILARLLTTSTESDGQLAVFDARRGTKRISMPSRENCGCGFSPSDTFWVGSRSPRRANPDGFQITCYDVPSGRKLWTCPQFCVADPLFTSDQAIFTAGATGIEKRSLRSGQLLQNVAGPTKNLVIWSLSPDESQIWSSHLNGQIWSWRVK